MAAAPTLSDALPPPPRRRPLVVTGDQELLDELLQIASGALVDVAPDPAAARPWYPGAPLVLIGIDAAELCLRAGLPRRRDVVLVGRYDTGQAPDWPVAEALGVDHIAALPEGDAWLRDRLAAVTAASADQFGKVIAVLGGRGGAGATVLATGLAVTAARLGQRTMLVDADPLGGGVDLVLGWESLDGLRWPELSQASGRISPPSLVDALPARGDLVVLSWDRGELLPAGPEAMASALDAGRRGRDIVVVDLPRRLDDASELALAAAQHGFLLVPAELRACAAAARVAALARSHCPSLAVVVRGPAPGGLTAREVARSLGLPLAGQMRGEVGLPGALERGRPPTGEGKGPLAELCEQLLRAILDGTEVAG